MEGSSGETPGGIHVHHGTQGLPGAFFNYEISPILVVHSDTRQSFAHFITSYVLPALLPIYIYANAIIRRTCAIVGGVLTVASLLDSVLFATSRALKKSGTGGFGSSSKLM